MNPERVITTRQAPTVLAVDDSPDIRRLLGRWLKDAGYEVLLAENAEEGLRIAKDCRVCMAICDVRMPGLDGMWLADQIRTHSPATKIVFATAVEDLHPFDTLKAGVVGYIVKPFERAQVIAVVCRALAQGGAATTVVTHRYLSAGTVRGEVMLPAMNGRVGESSDQ